MLDRLVGRTRELERLERSLERAAGGAGSVVVVRGEPGMGKTSLLSAFAAIAEQRAAVLWGACLEGGAAAPFGALRMALGSSGVEDEVERARAELGASAAVLTALLPGRSVGELLPAVPLAPWHAQLRLFEAVARLLRGVARVRPVLLVIDDLQVIDADSASLLLFLLARVPRERWLLALAMRSTAELSPTVIEAISRVPAAEHIELSGLDVESVRALASEQLGRPAPDRLVEALLRDTSGVPFYLRELLRSVEDDALPKRAPASLRLALEARLSRLSAASREVLEVVVLAPRPLSLALVADLMGVAPAEALERLEELGRAGMLRVEPGGGYAPHHAILRHTVLDGLLPDRCAWRCREMAQLLAGRAREEDADLIALLYWRSRDLPGAQGGAPWAMLGARRATRALAHERSAELLQIALDLMLPGDPGRGGVLVELAEAQSAALRFEAAQRSLTLALDEGVLAGRVVSVLRGMKQGGAPADLWRPAVDRAIEDASLTTNDRARLASLEERIAPLSRGPWFVSRWIAPEPSHVAALRATGEDDDLVASLSPYAPRTREETEALERRVAGMVAGSARIGAWDALVRDWLHRHSDYRRASRGARALLEESQRTGHLPGEAEGHYALAKCCAILGDLDQAGRHAALVPVIVERLGAAHRLRFAALTALHFEIHYFGGGPWAEIAEQAVRFARQTEAGQTPLGLLALALGALASSLAGDAGTAAEIVTALPELVARFELHDYQRKAAIDLGATAAFQLGLRERAESYRQLLLSAPVSEGTAPVCSTDLCLARMAALLGDRRETQRRYRRARAWATERGARPLAAIAQFEAGLAGGARRGMLAAREEVREAQQAFEAMKMVPWTRAAREVLGEPRALPDGLTLREAEVMALVARGLANKEVATELGVSAATVQRHLANAYGKLGLSSRTQATAYVLRVGLDYMAGPRRST